MKNKPEWPVEDVDDYTMFRQAANAVLSVVNKDRQFPLQMDEVRVYHLVLHDKEMTRWTAWVCTKYLETNRYFEVYHNGSTTYIVSGQTQPTNES